LNTGIRVATLLLLFPASATAQGFLEQFSYEGLGLTAIGVDFGAIASNNLTTEPVGGLRIDYGAFGPKVRLVFGASYFKGEFSDEKIAEFEQKLANVVQDPSGDFTIDVGSVTLADVEAFLDLQYLPGGWGRVQPYLGLGASAHIRNGDGAAIDGTFVEDALDTVAAGMNVTVGLEVAIVRWLSVLAELRGGLTSELRTVSARGGLMYRLP
jgi:hypothetical protein